MNNFTAITIVFWESRNWRHREKAALFCKNYGLGPIQKNIYAGTLYAKERRDLSKKLDALFAKKTERYSFCTICRTCFESSSFSGTSKKDIRKNMEKGPGFEIVQIDTFPHKTSKRP